MYVLLTVFYTDTILLLAQLAGVVEYTDFISAEAYDPHECSCKWH